MRLEKVFFGQFSEVRPFILLMSYWVFLWWGSKAGQRFQ